VATGRIVKALAGYYFVEPDRPEAGADGPIRCRARGIFKKRGESPLVGDRVDFTAIGGGEGTVDRIHPRSSVLIRPPVANIDLAVVVFSVAEPALNLQLLDKFLAFIEHAGIDALICLSKRDLADGPDGQEARDALETVRRIYPPIGYRLIETCARTGEGTDELREALRGRLSVVCGQSGVGKSSLLNAVVPGLALATNEISEKLGRGRHTTRHTELIPVGGGGYVADTPGFSQLDFGELGEDADLGSCFREFRELASGCRFRGCTHVREPGCAVTAALEEGQIARSRYNSYIAFLAEAGEKKRRY
jgi:ribosome biogenesis GTPase